MPSNGQRVQVPCPHCHDAIELVDDFTDEVICPSCGSSFRVDPFRTAPVSESKRSLIGKFELVEVVGHGACGTVYRALDTELMRTVAIKVPRNGQFASRDDED